ncbi:MAG: alpha/beta hydrolase [Eubacteriales bacterium]
MKKILFVHGWYHSKKRFQRLCADLSQFSCKAIDLPGFGDHKFSGDLHKIEEIHIAYVKEILEEGFDFVISHSWGCRIVLQALSSSATVAIMLNPAYGDNQQLKILKDREKVLEAIFTMSHKAPDFLTTVPIKIAALPSVNHYGQVDDIIVEDARKSDPQVSAKIVEIMCNKPFFTNKWNFPSQVHLLYSDQDRVISPSCFQDFINDLSPYTHFFPQVGHTLILEVYEALRLKITNILQLYTHSCIEFITWEDL